MEVKENPAVHEGSARTVNSMPRPTAIDCGERLERVFSRDGVNYLRGKDLLKRAWLEVLSDMCAEASSSKVLSPADAAERQSALVRFKTSSWCGDLPRLFLKHRPYLDRIVYSLIRVPDESLALELYCRLRTGEQDFATLAKRYSKGTEAMTCGLLGPVPSNSPHPKIARKLAAAKEGVVLSPEHVGEWHVILRLERRIGAAMDENTEAWLLDRAVEEWAMELLEEWEKHGHE